MTIAVCGLVSARAVAASDVPITAWFSGAVYFVNSHKLMGNKIDGMFHPEDPVSRAELATVMMRAHQREYLLELLFCANQNTYLSNAAVSEDLRKQYIDALEQLCQSPEGPLMTPTCTRVINLDTGEMSGLSCE
jgi:hypothetical protein